MDKKDKKNWVLQRPIKITQPLGDNVINNILAQEDYFAKLAANEAQQELAASKAPLGKENKLRVLMGELQKQAKKQGRTVQEVTLDYIAKNAEKVTPPVSSPNLGEQFFGKLKKTLGSVPKMAEDAAEGAVKKAGKLKSIVPGAGGIGLAGYLASRSPDAAAAGMDYMVPGGVENLGEGEENELKKLQDERTAQEYPQLGQAKEEVGNPFQNQYMNELKKRLGGN